MAFLILFHHFHVIMLKNLLTVHPLEKRSQRVAFSGIHKRLMLIYLQQKQSERPCRRTIRGHCKFSCQYSYKIERNDMQHINGSRTSFFLANAKIKIPNRRTTARSHPSVEHIPALHTVYEKSRTSLTLLIRLLYKISLCEMRWNFLLQLFPLGRNHVRSIVTICLKQGSLYASHQDFSC